jgi:outer membrane protein assembly factor BamD (BamD/ComL family)
VRIAERLPGSKLAERALLELADYYARVRELRMAVETYDVFVRLFPRSPMRANAMQRRIYATVAQFKGPRYDVRMLKDAQVQIEDFAAEFPAEAQRTGLNDGLVARLDESAATGMLTQAKWYADRDDPVSARLTLVRLVRRHPKTGAAHEALEFIKQLDEREPGIAKKKVGADREAANGSGESR